MSVSMLSSSVAHRYLCHPVVSVSVSLSSKMCQYLCYPIQRSIILQVPIVNLKMNSRVHYEQLLITIKVEVIINKYYYVSRLLDSDCNEHVTMVILFV